MLWAFEQRASKDVVTGISTLVQPHCGEFKSMRLVAEQKKRSAVKVLRSK
jgi:hypothetical protein